MTAPKRTRTLIANVGIALLSAALTAEAVLRIHDWARPSPIFYKPSYDRFRPQPHARHYSFAVNSMGFKDVEFRREKGDAYRVVALGDSFAFGVVPYGSGFLELVEDRLRGHGRRVEILNFGIRGIGPWQYLEVLVDEALGFDPDGVLLCFYVGNDFQDARRPVRRRKTHEYSHLASLIYFLTVQRVALPDHLPIGANARLGEYADESPTLEGARFLSLERQRAYVYRVGDQQFERDLGSVVAALLAVRRVCRERGIDLLVVLLPAEIQVDPTLQAEVTATFEPDARARWDFSAPSRALSAALDKAGIPRLDLHQAFAGAAQSQRLYKPRDTHWNLAGNRLAAEVVSDFIAATGVGKDPEPPDSR
jgi:hypothetical protein